MSNKRFKYEFHFSNESKMKFEVELDDKTGFIKLDVTDVKPSSWTALEHKQCSHCKLKKEQTSLCPVATNLSKVANACKDIKSYEVVKVIVKTDERIYLHKLSFQEGLYSLFGLIMATSQCDHMSFLRPMARFHLPFSTLEETYVRVFGFYLIQQYYKDKRGDSADFKMEKIKELYEDVRKVNLGIIDRIRAISKGDADLNSVYNLNCFAELLSSQLEKGLPEMERFFD